LNNQKIGCFVISLDTELAWGSFDKGLTPEKVKEFNATRICIKQLLNVFNKFQITATFAFVGHLMLSECNEVGGIKHPNLVRVKHDWYKRDWFTEDPASNIYCDPMWYGADVLEMVQNSEQKHEIASHSFSHIIYGDKGCSRQCAESDIQECIKVAKEKGITLTSFVFPRNSEGHKDVLKENGFSAYRGDGNEWYKAVKNKTLQKAFHLIDELFIFSPKTSIPIKDQFGLYKTIGNMLYLSRSGLRRYIPISNRVSKAKKGINKAICNKEVFHMWFHPFNLASDPEGLIKGLDEICSYVRKKIDEGVLTNLTITDLCRKNME